MFSPLVNLEINKCEYDLRPSDPPPVWPADQSGLGLPGPVYLGADLDGDLLRDVAALLPGHLVTLLL